MTDASELLRRYAETGDEEAFRQLVERHVGIVYSAALRKLNSDPHAAQDVAQTVFSDLARKAKFLPATVVLWVALPPHLPQGCGVRPQGKPPPGS